MGDDGRMRRYDSMEKTTHFDRIDTLDKKKIDQIERNKNLMNNLRLFFFAAVQEVSP